ncbi:MAG: phospho-N-acetylmuramoyl-pentapeptide-transferase [Armatimonadota bacterium]|nr:phospho-N-acetylmuramoyl-pentapeptide-transferase [Armatimonadota bacterium]
MDRPLLAAAAAAALTLILGRWAIPRLGALQVRQRIREDAPARHRQKAGTPTMGGLFVLAAAGAVALALAPRTPQVVWILGLMAAFGAVGAADDVLALRRGCNLGLRARERLALQGLVAVAAAVALSRWALAGAAVQIPRVGAVALGPLYAAFVVVYLMGVTNAVNLSDGLDGLAAGLVAMAAGVYAVLAARAGRTDVAVVAAAVAGASAAFVWFNAHPATVFMGDVGSNGLGGALGGIAIAAREEILLLVVGLVFVLEAASVLAQVLYFKATGGRRILRMSPLHHHFELVGWSETQIVTRLWLVGLAAALAGLALGA